MHKLLLITGDIAAGKSTFARLLSQRYRIPVFIKDDIKERLADNVGYADREENRRLSAAAVDLQLYFLYSCAPWGQDLILEANFRQQELEILQQTAQQYGYRMMTIFLFGDAKILHQRYLHRMQHENRHPAHLSQVIDHLEDFERIQHDLESIEIPGKVIRIDASDFTYQTDETLFSRLDAFMRE